ncbi:hypothetical protein EV702DRAFT_608212 [Suillus placidus]|uniref:F-box domain-containing protein n=1 Tax=Suillus placidus TaxID=48579 RepID=A0A9P7A3K5_9AGAM|nr:hypothetical protein EV702DRAFT_608212 [Suillus placidus]
MAKPLFITEILRVIIDELAVDDKQSLACLARTSKAFTDPCLDGLWHTMDSFIPLIPLLPISVRSALVGEKRSVWYHHKNLKSHWSTLFQRLKTHSRSGVRVQPCGEWEPFDKYARRVRIYRPTDNMYQLVSIHRGNYLFPNLRDLHWHNTGSYPMERWSLPSSLRSLTIIEHPTVGIEFFLDKIAHDAPELETLDIRFGPPARLTPYTTVYPLPFNRLESVTLVFPDLARVDICSFLSSAPITDLTVMLGNSAMMWQPGSLFHGLESLTIFGNPASASLFVEYVGSTRLWGVHLMLLDEDVTLSDCQKFLAALFKTHGQSLQVLCLNINGESLSSQNPSTINQLVNKFLSKLRLHRRSVVVAQFMNARWAQRDLLKNPLF